MSLLHDSNFVTRLTACRERGVWLLIRQSTRDQARRYQGSALVQRGQAKKLARFGVAATDVHVVDARGESGREDADRVLFEQLLEAAEQGKVGILALAFYHRLGRNEVDSARMFSALRKHKSLLVVNGTPYDPTQASDRLQLVIQSALAQFENDSRTHWFLLTRFELARNGKFRVALPTGLVWASPDDPVYRRAANAAGLDAWLRRFDEQQALYQIMSHKRVELGAEHGIVEASRGFRYVPLPFPDRDVVRAAELRLQWLLADGSLTSVLRRIGHPYVPTRGAPAVRTPDPAWPHPGRVPLMRTHGATWTPDMQVAWVPSERGALRAWFRSPALYGSYAFRSSLDARDVGSHDLNLGDDVDVDTDGAVRTALSAIAQEFETELPSDLLADPIATLERAGA